MDDDGLDCELSTMIWDVLKPNVKPRLLLGLQRTHDGAADSSSVEFWHDTA